jgi:hypothetical protein
MDNLYLLAMLNLVLSVPSIVICICRLNTMGHDTLMRVKFEYAFGVGVLVFSALRPLIDEWPGYATIGTTLLILVNLASSSNAWRGDTPPPSATGPAPLGNQPEIPQ